MHVLLGIGLMALGGAALVWGVRTATQAQRPLDLTGSLAAGLGVIVLVLGLVTSLVPGFL